MPQERTGIVTFKGGPLTLLGPELKVGDSAPDFETVNSDFEPVTLASSKGKARLFCAVPSLDTPVCSTQTKRFAAEVSKLPESVEVITVSADLPFAQSRWCTSEGVEATTISDHRSLSFCENYGVLIKELRLAARAIFVVDPNDKITYIEIVPEVASEPDYDKALEALKNAAG